MQIVRKKTELIVDDGYGSGVAGKVCNILLRTEHRTCSQETVQQLCVVTPTMGSCQEEHALNSSGQLSDPLILLCEKVGLVSKSATTTLNQFGSQDNGKAPFSSPSHPWSAR